MRILVEDNDKSVNRITIYLTVSEAKELESDLKSLIKNPIGNHSHISNEDFSKEITMCIYDDKFIDNNFNERSNKLIKYDK